MKKLGSLRSMRVTQNLFNEKVEFIIDGFIAKRMITMVYADGGNGKSWLALALARYCARTMFHVFYLDFE